MSKSAIVAATLAATLACGGRTSLTDDLAGEGGSGDAAAADGNGDDGGSGCFMAGLAPTHLCTYLNISIPDFQCPGAPGPVYETGTCPPSGLFGCCVVKMLGTYSSTHAICYYAPDELALAARKSCETWMPAGATVVWQTRPP